jgi:hypothetical protein
VYTLSLIQAVIIAKIAAKMSLRQIARQYGKSLTHGDIARMRDGIEPKGASKRLAFDLPATAPVPICPRHGVAHKGRCPRRKSWNETPIAEQPAALLRWRLKNREIVNDD